MDTLSSPTRPSGKDEKSKGGHPPGLAHKALITRNLRLAYDEVAGEPIPNRILDLLEQMDRKEGGGA